MDPQDVKRGIAGVFDRSAPTYDQTGLGFFGPFGELVVRAAGLQPGERVLDVGCGRGAVLLPAATAVGESGRVDGVDLSPGMVQQLTADLDRLPQARVVVGDAEDPPVQGQYDAVTAGLVLFFLPDPVAALRRYHSLLRPGGRVVVSTFGPEDERWKPVFGAAAAHLPAGMAPPRPPAAEAFASDETVAALFQAAGFDEVQHEHELHVTTFPTPDDWWAWTWSHGALAFWERIPADRLPAAKDAAFQAIEQLRYADGAITLRTEARITRGVRRD